MAIFEIAKNEILLKKIHEIDLFDLTNYFGLDFFNFSGPLWCLNKLSIICRKETIYFFHFFKIENCYGTLHWPLILSLYQKNYLLRVAISSMQFCEEKQTKKNHLWRPRTYFKQPRLLFKNAALNRLHLLCVYVLYLYCITLYVMYFADIYRSSAVGIAFLLKLYQKVQTKYDTKMFEITSFLHPNCDNLEAKKQFCIQ